MPQSQTAALPIHQEETDKTKQAQIERSGMKPTDRNPVTETINSIQDCKTKVFLTWFILGLYYGVLNIHYPTKWKLRPTATVIF